MDVREPHEWEISNLGHLGATLIPKGQVLERMGELDTAQEIVVQCRTGVRSAEIVHLLQEDVEMQDLEAKMDELCKEKKLLEKEIGLMKSIIEVRKKED